MVSPGSSMEAIIWHDFVLDFLYEEEKIPLLTSCLSTYIAFHGELLDIRADYHSLLAYHADKAAEEAEYQALREDLRSSSSGRSS